MMQFITIKHFKIFSMHLILAAFPLLLLTGFTGIHVLHHHPLFGTNEEENES
jgi:hypothetical protein